MNIYNYLIRNSFKFKKKNAIIYNEKEITYQELLILVDFYSSKFLKEFKIKSNDRISVLMENSIEYILIILVACKLNITVQTLGTYYSKCLVGSRLKKFNPKFIFTKNYHQHLFYDKRKIKIIEYDEKLIFPKKIKKKNYTQNRINKKLLAVESSGTTGSSKTVIFSESCKIKRAHSAIDAYKLSSRDVFIATAPFDHSVGHRQIFLPLILGSTNIILKNFHPKIWLECIQKYKVSFTLLISTQITKILESIKLKKKYIGSLKNIVSVSTKLNQNDKIKLLKLNVGLHEMYGTCEVGTATSINLKLNKRKSNSVGRACKNYKIKIIRDNKICTSNEIGEIVVYSPNLFEEYYNSKNNKKEIFYKNYFKTGDLGYLDENKYLYFTGREKNVVKINGLSVYPEEIEQKIKKNLNLNNFIIIGSKNCFGNEKLLLFVEKLSELKLKKLNKFLSNKLEKYEIPQKVIILKKLPRTNLGKISSSELRNYKI